MSKRDNQIIELIHKYGELSVQELSDLLGVSTSTVRRDLVSVSDHRFIGRTHGGIILETVIKYSNLCINRVSIDPREVRAIALRAAEMIQPGDVIGLSGGEICAYLAFLLRLKEDITVVTNAVNVAAELVCLPGIQVRLTGGRLNNGSFELVGKGLEPSLDGVHIQKFFLGTDGLSLDNGVTAHDEAEATASRDLMAHTTANIILVDSRKFKRTSFAQVAPLSNFQTIITTELVSPSVLAEFQSIGVETIIAPLI
jgi:DeoR family transcriptional regulator, aga operon transcriptional repressor